MPARRASSSVAFGGGLCAVLVRGRGGGVGRAGLLVEYEDRRGRVFSVESAVV